MGTSGIPNLEINVKTVKRDAIAFISAGGRRTKILSLNIQYTLLIMDT